MKKTFILITALAVLALLLLTLLLSGKKTGQREVNEIPQSSASPGESQTSVSNQPLVVVSSTPEDGSIVAIDNPIYFTFNKDISNEAPNITVSPSSAFTYKITSDLLFINLAKGLSPNTPYSISVFVSGMNSVYRVSFTTTSSTSNYGDQGKPDATVNGPCNLGQSLPYLFLSNRVPHSESDFSVALGALKPDPSSHFVFIVTMTNPDQNRVKQSLYNWLNSLCFSKDQESQLEFIYITPDQAKSVQSFKDSLPNYASSFSILYDKTSDATTITLNTSNGQSGEKDLDAYLAQYGVQDKYWINNLTINYQ